MHIPKRQIFRESAIQHYIKNREKDVLLRIIPLPMAIFLWVLLSILFMAGLFAWSERIPTYTSGPGIIQQGSGDSSVAVVFLPAGPPTTIHMGQSVQIQIGASGPQMQGKIMAINSSITSPDHIRQQFKLTGNSSQLVTQPTLIVLVTFTTKISATTYAGSSLSARIEVGSQRILSQLPWIGPLIGN